VPATPWASATCRGWDDGTRSRDGRRSGRRRRRRRPVDGRIGGRSSAPLGPRGVEVFFRPVGRSSRLARGFMARTTRCCWCWTNPRPHSTRRTEPRPVRALRRCRVVPPPATTMAASPSWCRTAFFHGADGRPHRRARTGARVGRGWHATNDSHGPRRGVRPTLYGIQAAAYRLNGCLEAARRLRSGYDEPRCVGPVAGPREARHVLFTPPTRSTRSRPPHAAGGARSA